MTRTLLRGTAARTDIGYPCESFLKAATPAAKKMRAIRGFALSRGQAASLMILPDGGFRDVGHKDTEFRPVVCRRRRAGAGACAGATANFPRLAPQTMGASAVPVTGG